MKLFYTNASAKEEIGKLEGQIATLQGDLSARDAEIVTLKEQLQTAQTDLEAMTTERDEAATALETSEASLTTANTALEVANGKLATFDADVETAAAARFAGLGGNPLPESGKDDEGKQEIAGLTGLAKATAIHKAQAESRKK
jgi:chromosome segregation ATPase